MITGGGSGDGGNEMTAGGRICGVTTGDLGGCGSGMITGGWGDNGGGGMAAGGGGGEMKTGN